MNRTTSNKRQRTMDEIPNLGEDGNARTYRHCTSARDPCPRFLPDARAEIPNSQEPSHSMTDDDLQTTEATPKKPTLGLEQSPLALLPAELRLRIYGLVLGNATFIIARDEGEIGVAQCPTYPTEHSIWGSELLRTCHQVYAEAADIVFKENFFEIRSWSLLTTFADIVTWRKFDKIRNIRMDITKDALPGPSRMFSRWYTLWVTLSCMSDLRRLVVVIDYWHLYGVQLKHTENFLPILEPFYLLKGISEFSLEFQCYSVHPFAWKWWQLEALPAQTLTMIGDIQKAAKGPRTVSYGEPLA
ncbi:MAG: hypothetical protein Q9192_001767 [Flavoplaca navasiana]